METDKNLHFIRNLEYFESDDVNISTYEYEILAYSTIFGEFEYGPYYFTIWEFGIKPPGQERKLILKIKQSNKLFEEYRIESEKNDIYHGGGIADEIVYLSSLFLRRRLKLSKCVRTDDSPRILNFKTGFIDIELISGESNLNNISEILKLTKNLKIELQEKFILSAKLYHQALLQIEDYTDIAYLNLISAIEVLCQNYRINKSISDINDKALNDFYNKLDDELKKEFEIIILRRERLIKTNFVKFILDHLDDSFWNYEKRPKVFGRIKEDEIEDILKRIYDYRSKLLHTGEQFPIYIFYPPESINKNEYAEIPFCEGTGTLGKMWNKNEFIPYPHFFERLVNHVLINFLRKNQNN